MTNKTTNEIIYEWCDGTGCRHRCLTQIAGTAIMRCDDCYKEFADNEEWAIPDYEADLNAFHDAEKKVVETFGLEAYLRALLAQLPEVKWIPIINLVTAPADVRCKALVSLIEKEKE